MTDKRTRLGTFRYSGNVKRHKNKGKRKKTLLPSFKKWNKEKLLDAIRKEILENHLPKPFATYPIYILAEDFALKFRATKGLITWCFHRLNLEGILGQAVNIPPHDSTRNSFFYGGDSAWSASRYEVLNYTDTKE